MNRKKLLILCGTFSCHALSGETGWVNVTRVGTGYDNDRVNIYVSDTVKNTAGCALSNYYQVNGDADNRDKIFSIALMANASNKEVNIAFSDDSCSDSNRPLIYGISVR